MILRVGGGHRLSVLLGAAITVVTVVAACGDSSPPSATFDGGGGNGSSSGAAADGTSTSNSSGGIVLGDGNAGGSGGGSNGGGASGSSNGASGGGSSGASGGGPVDASFTCDGCAPFPTTGTAPCDPTTLAPSTLVYPPDGVLLPPNMNVLEVQWVPPTGAALFEVDFENGATDVRVETPCNPITSVRGAANLGCGLTLSQPQWNDIANTNRDGDPVKITVRAIPAGGQCVTSSQESVSIGFAKDDLTGGIYYWQSATYGGVAGTTGGIYFHDFGTFDPTPTPFYTSGGTGTCVGCHTLSKDGARMSLMTDDPDADDEYGDVKTHVMDVGSRTVTGGQNVGPGFQTFTHDHALMIASMFKMGMNGSFSVWDGNGSKQLATDLLPKTGTVQLQGTQPNLSWDDSTLVFVAPGTNAMGQTTISMAGDHHFLGGSLWSASFDVNAHTLTNFATVLGSTGGKNFYYPDQSVDGNWLVFNEADDTSAANNTNDCFYNRKARVKVMHFPPQAGDQPLDLGNLNIADGLSNSWPRWSPAVTSYRGKTVLWVTFSSNRDYGLHLKNTANGYPSGPPSFDNYYPPESPMYDQPQPMTKMGVTFDNYAAPQIWMAAVVIDPQRTLDAQDRSFPAFWLPFQDVTAHNHSAQWVATVATTPPPGGGGDGGNSSDASSGGSSGGSGSSGSSGSSGAGSPDSGPSCVGANGVCGPGGGVCCSDVVCCPGTTYLCQYTCLF